MPQNYTKYHSSTVLLYAATTVAVDHVCVNAASHGRYMDLTTTMCSFFQFTAIYTCSLNYYWSFYFLLNNTNNYDYWFSDKIITTTVHLIDVQQY